MDKKYDIIIIGSGLGGLLTGNILSRKGYKTAILEKNAYPGGCLQSFDIDGITFDTGIHYVGGFKKGQVLHRLFNYLNVIPGLNLRKMDAEGFDHFLIGEKEFEYPVGYTNFREKMESYFPEEKGAIKKYIEKIRDIAGSVSLYNLHPTKFDAQRFYAKYSYGSLWEFIQSITGDTVLQNLLTAQNTLYAGKPDSTFLFVHALITNHYIEGPWRFVDGSRQMADALVKEFTRSGGDIFYNEPVSRLHFSDDRVKSAVTSGGKEYVAANFISAIHPYPLMEMIDPEKIRKTYRKRIRNLNNTSSMFNLYVVLKDGFMPYMNYNYYYYPNGNVWALSYYDADQFPQAMSVYPVADSIDEKYQRGLSVLTFMDYSEVSAWENSNVKERGEEYAAFKEMKSQKVISGLENIFPGIRDHIQSYVAATPLTFRDYTGTHKGSVYGIERDYRSPNSSLLFPKTKVPNLYLTGQNLSLHGMLGVSMGALLTCSEFMDVNELIEEINHV
jgi:all-trans-retinol 13,14-reductase